MLTIAPQDQAYGAVKEQLSGGSAEEAVGGEPVLFRPVRSAVGDPHAPARPRPSPAQ